MDKSSKTKYKDLGLTEAQYKESYRVDDRFIGGASRSTRREPTSSDEHIRDDDYHEEFTKFWTEHVKEKLADRVGAVLVGIVDNSLVLTASEAVRLVHQNEELYLVDEREIKKTFEMFDSDKSGEISISELKSVVHVLGQNMSDAEIKDMMKSADTDGSGMIDFNEFLVMISKQYKDKEEQETEIKNAFKTFDKNGDGYISVRELKYALTHMGEALTDEQVQDIFRDADQDGDGFLSYEEFAAYLCN